MHALALIGAVRRPARRLVPAAASGTCAPGATLAQAQRRADDDCGAPGDAVSRVEPAARRPRPCRCSRCSSSDYRLGLLVLLGAVGVVLLDRVRERREPAARPRHDASARAGDSHGARRRPRPHRAAAAHREHGARWRWRAARRTARRACGANERWWRRQPDRHPAAPRRAPRRHGPGVHVLGARSSTALALRPAAGAAGRRATDAGETLKDEGRGASGARTARTRQALVVAEVALSLVLLAGAGLLVRSLLQLQRVDPGLRARARRRASRSCCRARATTMRRRASRSTARLLDETAPHPGRGRIGRLDDAPAVRQQYRRRHPDSRASPTIRRTAESAPFFAVSPDYFKAMGIRAGARTRLHRSRRRHGAARGDRQRGAARASYWPGEDPIGTAGAARLQQDRPARDRRRRRRRQERSARGSVNRRDLRAVPADAVAVHVGGRPDARRSDRGGGRAARVCCRSSIRRRPPADVKLLDELRAAGDGDAALHGRADRQLRRRSRCCSPASASTA